MTSARSVEFLPDREGVLVHRAQPQAVELARPLGEVGVGPVAVDPLDGRVPYFATSLSRPPRRRAWCCRRRSSRRSGPSSRWGPHPQPRLHAAGVGRGRGRWRDRRTGRRPGLAATGREVLLLEGSPRVGGKLRTEEVAGLAVDVGAEAMLARRPEGIDLARELGAEVVHPTAATSGLWSRGALRDLPRSLMGVPLDHDQLAASGVLSPEGLARARPRDRHRHRARRRRVRGGPRGLAARRRDRRPARRAAARRGVRRPRAAHLRGRGRAAAARHGAARRACWSRPRRVPASVAPVFAALPGGMGRLPGLLVDGGGFEVRTSATVRALRRTTSGWALTVGPTTHPETVEAAAVVLATPAAAAARLLADDVPDASAELAGIERRERRGRDARLPRRGPAGRAVRALRLPRPARRAAHHQGLHLLLRQVGLGARPRPRRGGPADLAGPPRRGGDPAGRATTGWSRVSLADLAAMAGITARPVDSHVQRWGGALPQYAVGHLDRVARIRAAVAAASRASPCAERRTTGWASRRCIGSARRAVASVTRAE